MIYVNNKKAIIYSGSYKPVNFYAGSKKIAGWDFAEAEGTEIAVNNTYNNTLEAKFYGKSELKFDVAECVGNTTQEVHEASANLFDINETIHKDIIFDDKLVTSGSSYVCTALDNDAIRKIFLIGKERRIKYHAKIVDVPAGLTFYETQAVMGFILYNKTASKMIGSFYAKVTEENLIVGYEFDFKSSKTFTANDFAEDDEIVLWLYNPGNPDQKLYTKVEISNIMISAEDVPYEPYREKTPTLLNPSLVHASYEGGINVLPADNVTTTNGLTYELTESGGYHVTGFIESAFAQLIFAHDITIKAGTYYGCAQNARSINLICHDENGNNKYMSVKNDGSALAIEEDTTFIRVYIQFPGGGAQIDEVVYPFIGTQYATKYIPFGSAHGKYQINHADKKYEIQLPVDMHGFAWDDVEYRNVLQVDFLHKRFNLRKKVGSYVVPTTQTFSANNWTNGSRNIQMLQTKKTGAGTVGNCAFAKAQKVIGNARDSIGPSTMYNPIYWKPDLAALGISGDATINEANAILQDVLSKLSAEERTITYALAKEVVLSGDIVEVEDSTLPELSLEAVEITEQSFDYPAVIEATGGTVTVEGGNLFDISQKQGNSFITINGNKIITRGIAYTPQIFGTSEIQNLFPAGEKRYLKCNLKIVEIPPGTQLTHSGFGFSIWNSTKRKTHAYVMPSVTLDTFREGYEVDCECEVTLIPDGVNYDIGDSITLNVYCPGNSAEKQWATVEISSIIISAEDVPYAPYFPCAQASLPSLHGLEQLDSATKYDYVDENGKKIVSDYIMKTREKVDGVFADKVYKTKKFSIVELDGSDDEAWRLSTDQNLFSISLQNAASTDVVNSQNVFICTHEKYSIAIWSSPGVRHGFCGNMGSVHFRNLDCADLDEWRAFLAARATAGTPVQVMYKLAEPITTDITDTDEGQAILALKTIPYHTRIYSDSNYYIKAKMRVWKGGES